MSEAYPDILVSMGTVGKLDTDFPGAQNGRNCKLQLRLFLYPFLYQLKFQLYLVIMDIHLSETSGLSVFVTYNYF